jgi:hypothetical protein
MYADAGEIGAKPRRLFSPDLFRGGSGHRVRFQFQVLRHHSPDETKWTPFPYPYHVVRYHAADYASPIHTTLALA